MPILGREDCIYPPTLFESPPEAAGNSIWWVLYTKARQEKALARGLFASQVAFYLPLIPHAHVYRGRRVTSQIPLFPGYVFLRGTEDDRLASLATNRVSRVLPVPADDELPAQLQRIHHMIAAGIPLSVEERLQPGRRVRVCRGPLEGIEGTVLTRRGKTHLLVAVNFIQRGASIEIDATYLETT